MFKLQGKLYMIMEICRTFAQIFKEHLDGVYVFSDLHFFFYLAPFWFGVQPFEI